MKYRIRETPYGKFIAERRGFMWAWHIIEDPMDHDRFIFDSKDGALACINRHRLGKIREHDIIHAVP